MAILAKVGNAVDGYRSRKPKRQPDDYTHDQGPLRKLARAHWAVGGVEKVTCVLCGLPAPVLYPDCICNKGSKPEDAKDEIENGVSVDVREAFDSWENREDCLIYKNWDGDEALWLSALTSSTLRY